MSSDLRGQVPGRPAVRVHQLEALHPVLAALALLVLPPLLQVVVQTGQPSADTIPVSIISSVLPYDAHRISNMVPLWGEAVQHDISNQKFQQNVKASAACDSALVPRHLTTQQRKQPRMKLRTC